MEYIRYRLRSLEPLKIGSSNISVSTSFSKEYIAGSAIRGAVINQMIRNGLDLADENVKKDILMHAGFSNANIVAENKRSIAAPLGFLAEKKVLSSYQGDKIAIRSIYDDNLIGKKPVKKEPFVIVDDETLKGVSVSKEFNLHIAVNGTDDHKAMFRYEALSDNQEFEGYIFLDAVSNTDIKDEIKNALESDIIYIGGSKGSGYGRCLVSDVEVITGDNPEVIDSISYQKGDEFYIYFLSDTVLQNAFGESVNYLDEETFKNLLRTDIKVSYQDGAVENIIVSGYNNTYGGTLPQYMGIKAGSVQRYMIEDNVSDDFSDRIHALEEKGLGIRCEEGYGRILITGRLPFHCLMHVSESEEAEEHISLSDEAKEQLAIIWKRLYIQKCKHEISSVIEQESRKMDMKSITVKKSQLGKIIQMLERGHRITAVDLQKEFEEYFDHMNGKKNNPSVSRTFTDSKIAGKKLKDYILDLVNRSDKELLFECEKAKPVAYKELTVSLFKNEIYELNVYYLIELLKYIRKEVRE
ncbi:MAG: RAMP superfamily CRISPR-associated protein [Lachnospiraceae bacterium]|nr:RAMP superfamily CRISPR-associated protein [Lachnospiraceae bacterium]